MKPGPLRSWDWPSAAILILAQLMVCQRLAVTNWSRGLTLPVLLTLLGVTIGLALGLSRFSAGMASLLAIAYGLLLIPLLGGEVFSDNTAWLERLANLGMRLSASFELFITRRPVVDPILFIVFITIIFWIISLTAGYAVTRSGNFIRAMLPGGIALFTIQLYDPGSRARLIFLGVYFFLGLLLLGRLAYTRQRLFWKEQRIWVSSESATDLNFTILVMAMLLVFLTWAVPVSQQPPLEAKIVWNKVTQPLQQTRRDLGNAVAGLAGSPSVRTDDYYGDYLALGQQASGDASVLFTVRLPFTQNVPRDYWRVRTYDTYENDEWQNSSVSDQAVSAAHLINSVDAQGLPTGEFVFSIPQANLAMLVTPPRTVWMDHAAIMSYVPLQTGELEPILFQVTPPILAGGQYKVHAALSNPTIAQLIAAGNLYPSWVTDRYLQLPANLPPQIGALAAQIAAGADTPYAKAEAITQYLRNTIQYTKVVPPPPAGEDTLVWFLFDYKAGFCNYYATAEVVMLRALGIPARLAVGYAQGEYQAPDLRIVRQEDAHAWPEVYFPGIGWVEFEPTASQAPLDRPSGEPSANPGPGGSSPLAGGALNPAGGAPLPAEETGTGSGKGFNDLVLVTGLVLLLTVLVLGSALAILLGVGDRIAMRLPPAFRTRLPTLLVRGWTEVGLPPPHWLERWARHAGLTPMERAYGTVYRSLRSLGGQTPPAQTAAEAAAVLTDRLPLAAQDIHTLLNEYQRAQYSESSADLWVARRAAESLRRQAVRAVLHRHLAPLERLFRKKR
ncbi:MAG: transglutaminase-like domain-containing protein [Anaerolineales bacterium]